MKPIEIGSVPTKIFEKNNSIPILIPRSGKIFNGNVIVEGEVTIAADGASNGVVVGEGGPTNLIKRITLRANPARGSRYPGGDIVDCEPRDLLRFSIAEVSKLVKDVGGSTLGNGAPGTYPVYLSIPIYFADNNHFRQSLTALNADKRAYESLLLTVKTGDITSCFEGNDRTVTYDLKVRWQDERFDLPGDSITLFQKSHRTFIPQSKDDFTDDAFPVNEGRLLYWLLMTEKAKAELTDGILNKLKVTHPALNFERFAMDVREKMVRDGWYDASESMVGQYFFDFAQGNAAGGLTLADLDIEFDVTMLGAPNVDCLHTFVRFIKDTASYNPQIMAEYAKAE